MTKMHRFSARISFAFALACAVAWTVKAKADVVLVLPASSYVPGDAFSSQIVTATRLAVAEMGHQVVFASEDIAAQSRAQNWLSSNNQSTNTDALGILARDTAAQWVVVPGYVAGIAETQLEILAYYAPMGRVESVSRSSRSIDTAGIHSHVIEMLRVLLRIQGVGTDALPWESSEETLGASTASGFPINPPSEDPSRLQNHEEAKTSETSDRQSSMKILLGAALGFSSALSRPDGAVGNTAALHAGLRAGVQLRNPFEFAVGARWNLAGPKAAGLDLSARYWVQISDAFRLAPEVAPGLFFRQGGAEGTSFSLRFTAVGALDLAPGFSIEAHLGDITWVPSKAGALVLGGVTVAGVARF